MLWLGLGSLESRLTLNMAGIVLEAGCVCHPWARQTWLKAEKPRGRSKGTCGKPGPDLKQKVVGKQKQAGAAGSGGLLFRGPQDSEVPRFTKRLAELSKMAVLTLTNYHKGRAQLKIISRKGA